MKTREDIARMCDQLDRLQPWTPEWEQMYDRVRKGQEELIPEMGMHIKHFKEKPFFDGVYRDIKYEQITSVVDFWHIYVGDALLVRDRDNGVIWHYAEGKRKDEWFVLRLI